MDFSVVISASGRADVSIASTGESLAPRLVHAVSVSQPVQSWTVIREHVDFVAVGNELSTVIHGLHSCPPAPTFLPSPSADEVDDIVKSRNAAQDWLTNILLYPGARESPAVRHFLCYGANTVPPQFERVAWLSFSTSSGSRMQQNQGMPSKTSHGGGGAETNNFELEMDDMFAYGGVSDGEHQSGEDYDDDDGTDYYSATERYRPTEEAVTYDDVMDIQNNAHDVEMIEDLGSLAQSLGASHLGRSLQLQAQLANAIPERQPEQPSRSPQNGLTVGGSGTSNNISGNGIGGIGNAVENAGAFIFQPNIAGLGDSFHQTTPVSAPRLDSFRMIKVIGKGSFGKVFLVSEIKTDEMFALKVLRKDNIIKRNQVEHTRTERNVLGYVDHPFIVGLNMAFQSNDKLYFVLDYCPGGELFFQLGKKGKFSEPRARFYAAEIVLAIAYIHELDIIYRDLKPENVLLDARGHVRLTDFGLSKEGISSSSSGATSFCGTPEYLAPEILNRQGYGRAVDWWSLGALVYEMLTGLPPFYCQDTKKLFERIRKGHLDYPSFLSSSAQGLLRGLLTKDPRSRLGSGPRDADDIQKHAFFAEIDWDQLLSGGIAPPWDPHIRASSDTRQFDEKFTSMPIFGPHSLQPQHGFETPHDNVFEGFTLTDRGFYGPSGRV